MFIYGAVVGVFIYLISIVVLWKNSKIWRHKPTEFFTMVSEYFFERPDLLKKKHPDLYRMLERCFNTSEGLITVACLEIFKRIILPNYGTNLLGSPRDS